MSISPHEVITEADMKYYSENGKLPRSYPSSSDVECSQLLRKDIEEPLTEIMRALEANPNSSQDELFECCAKAFQIAETLIKKSRKNNQT